MTAFSAAILLQRLRAQAEIAAAGERDERGLQTSTRFCDRTAEDQARWLRVAIERSKGC